MRLGGSPWRSPRRRMYVLFLLLCIKCNSTSSIPDKGNILLATPIMDESQRAIKLANNSLSSKSTRHIDIKHNFIRDAVQEGNVNMIIIYQVCTSRYQVNQLADILTKGGVGHENLQQARVGGGG